jgi:PadR family transcriptional regulator PadR
MIGKPMRDPIIREFLLAFWKIHILHHADEQGIYGQWMLEELQRHGYRLSPGTLYPMLSRMAARGWLRSAEPKRSKAARIYRLTPRGQDVLNRIRESLDELYHEVGGHEVGGHEVGGHEVGGPRSTPHHSGPERRKRRQPKPKPQR